jgi:uncharacterized protein (TIGR00725 family)
MAESDRPYIAVVGGGECDAGCEQAAEEVGRRVAEAGGVLVCGGLGGVMEAACRGAAEAGGVTVGLLGGDSRSDANCHVSIALATGLGEVRNALVARSADAVIAIGGEYGTLSEIAFALKLDKPVIGLNTWQLSHSEDIDPGIQVASSASEAVERALTLARR